MFRSIRCHFETYVLQPDREPPPTRGERLHLDDPVYVRQLLMSLMTDPACSTELRRLLYHFNFHNVRLMDNDEVVRQVVVRLCRGEIQIFQTKEPQINVGAPEQQEPRPVPILDSDIKPTSWIRVRVENDETGAPVPAACLSMRLPDRKTRPVSTRSDGEVAITEIFSGTCTVSCKLEGATVDNTLHLVRTSSGPALPPGQQAPGTGDAGPGFKTHRSVQGDLLCARVEIHRVGAGESLAILARRAGMTWQALAEFNWGTADPDVVRGHLGSDMTEGVPVKEVKLGMEIRRPGIIYIPHRVLIEDLATEHRHTLFVQPLKGNLHLRLRIHPRDAHGQDDCFCLLSEDGSFKQERTVKDDLIPGDDFLDLLFEGLRRDLRYSLRVEAGAGKTPYLLFENVPFTELSRLPRPAFDPTEDESSLDLDEDAADLAFNFMEEEP